MFYVASAAEYTTCTKRFPKFLFLLHLVTFREEDIPDNVCLMKAAGESNNHLCWNNRAVVAFSMCWVVMSNCQLTKRQQYFPNLMRNSAHCSQKPVQLFKTNHLSHIVMHFIKCCNFVSILCKCYYSNLLLIPAFKKKKTPPKTFYILFFVPLVLTCKYVNSLFKWFKPIKLKKVPSFCVGMRFKNKLVWKVYAVF